MLMAVEILAANVRLEWQISRYLFTLNQIKHTAIISRRQKMNSDQFILTTPIEIQSFDKARFLDYRTLRLEALRESPTAFGSSYEEEILLIEDEWKKRLQNARFAVVEGKPIGIIVLGFNRRAKTRQLQRFSVCMSMLIIGAGV